MIIVQATIFYSSTTGKSVKPDTYLVKLSPEHSTFSVEYEKYRFKLPLLFGTKTVFKRKVKQIILANYNRFYPLFIMSHYKNIMQRNICYVS